MDNLFIILWIIFALPFTNLDKISGNIHNYVPKNENKIFDSFLSALSRFVAVTVLKEFDQFLYECMSVYLGLWSAEDVAEEGDGQAEDGGDVRLPQHLTPHKPRVDRVGRHTATSPTPKRESLTKLDWPTKVIWLDRSCWGQLTQDIKDFLNLLFLIVWQKLTVLF